MGMGCVVWRVDTCDSKLTMNRFTSNGEVATSLSVHSLMPIFL